MKKFVMILIGLIAIQIYMVYNNDNIFASEQNSIEEIVNEYIYKYSENNCSASNYEIIYDFNNNEYILQHLNPVGYMIIDTGTQKLLEASFSSNSVYLDYNNSLCKYYLGPLNYFILNENGIYDIVNNKYIENIENLIESSSIFSQNIVASVNNEVSNPNVSTYATVTDSNGYTVIDNHEYFRYLTTFPWNEKGTCGYVALAMLLGYFEIFYNNNTIPYETDVSNEFDSQFSEFNYLYGKNQRIVETKTANLLEFSDWCVYNNYKTGYFGGAGERLHNIFIDYDQNFYSDETNNSTPVSGVHLFNTFELYLDQYIFDSEYAYSYEYNSINPTSLIKSKINEGFPCIGVMISYDYTSGLYNGSGSYHDVVIYGYKDDMYLAHLGWYETEPDGVKDPNGHIIGDITNYSSLANNDKYTEILVSNVTFQSAFAITYDGTHKHSDYMLWETNGCEGTYCPCGYYECNHANLDSFTPYDNTKHMSVCNGCTQTVYNEHNFFTNTSEMLECLDCGYTSSVCEHHYQYVSGYTTSVHNVECTICGNIAVEAHQFVANLKGKTCSICGYFKTNETITPTLPPSSNKEEDEEEYEC